MKATFRVWRWVAVVVCAIAVGGGAWGWMRPSDRISLDVRKMPVREVARKLERQTGQTIVVHSNVTGTVTLKAKGILLEKALEIIGEQTFSRAGAIYPLYSDRKALAGLKAVLSGEGGATSGWTNLQGGGMRFGGPGPRREEGTNRTVSLNISFEPVDFAALAFSRLTPARVVVEDGATNRVSVSLSNAPVEKAVALLAKKAERNWAHIYTLTGGGLGRGPGPGMGRMAGGVRPAAREISDEEAVDREVLKEKLMSTLPEEEREKREEAAAEREKRMEEMKNMTPEQRMQTAMQAGPRGGSQRMLERLKNTTPEQRAEQRRQMAQRGANRAQPVTRN